MPAEQAPQARLLLATGSERVRPFLPAKDFGLSTRFYATLGFEKVLNSDVAIFTLGGCKATTSKEWAENFMMNLMAENLGAWWAHIQSADLPARFGVAQPKPPALQPWGLNVAQVDPSGVLGHVAQGAPTPHRTGRRGPHPGIRHSPGTDSSTGASYVEADYSNRPSARRATQLQSGGTSRRLSLRLGPGPLRPRLR